MSFAVNYSDGVHGEVDVIVPQPAVCAKKNKKTRGTAGWAVKVTGHKSQVEKTLRFDLHLRLAPSRRPAVWLWPPAALFGIGVVLEPVHDVDCAAP